MSVRKYVKKPIEIEAIQWDGSEQAYNDIVDFVPNSLLSGSKEEGDEFRLYIWNEEEQQDIGIPEGHFIIKGVNGEFYPCSPDVMEKSYDKTW